jgi:2-polyprenyl-3-methyl-5-hydroxy-6-metoxy-1,4-benzoquinol methylase
MGSIKSWGETIWEDKIKEQGEVGVISGTNGSKKEIDKRTVHTVKLLESKVLPHIKTKAKILDLGVGPMARLAIAMAKRNYAVTGVDISQTTLEYASKYCKASGVKVNLVKDDIIELKNIKEEFDLIYCIETFEHIPKHLSLVALNRFNKLLSKNGVCLVEFDIESKKTFGRELFRFLYFIGYKLKSAFKKTFPVTCYSYTVAEVEDLVQRANFKLVSRTGNFFLLRK